MVVAHLNVRGNLGDTAVGLSRIPIDDALVAPLERFLTALGDAVRVCTARARAWAMLTNLLDNAVRCSPGGTASQLRAMCPGDEAVFASGACGHGMPVAQRESPVVPCQRLDASDGRAKGGAGLCRAIRGRIVQAHGGRPWTARPAAQGGSVSFALPARAKVVAR